jgi:membrane protease YdiL (CAAX protease family)
MGAISARSLVWPGFVLVSLLLLGTFDLWLYGLIGPVAALALALVSQRPRRSLFTGERDRLDLAVIGLVYVLVVGLFLIAFEVFTTDRTAGLFLAFAGGMVVGVVGPLVYTVWIRDRPLASLGIGRQNLGQTLVLGLVFTGVQFALTLYGYNLPANREDWLPLLVMSLAVGFFEVVFFRGFVQSRLEASFGLVPGIFGAALLYALYHVGYGMGPGEMTFLFGLGVVYAIAYRLTENVLILWPLLVPLGSFYNNVDSGDIDLPWASIAGFADVLAVFAVAIALAARHERRRGRQISQAPRRGQAAAVR